jgi:DNA-binding PadR family transcriptional regulator
MTNNHFQICQLLMNNVRGLYGGEIVSLLNGAIGETTLYVELQRMREAGVVNVQLVPQADAKDMPRRLYTITKRGLSRYNNTDSLDMPLAPTQS